MKRRFLLQSIPLSAAGIVMPQWNNQRRSDSKHDFSYCLNTSTIMGQKLGIMEELRLAGGAGYDGIEIWIRSLEAHLQSGGSLADVRMLAEDEGLRIENAIGFAQWIVNDENLRTEALEQARREMDMLAQIGCRRIAAPPAGATEGRSLDLDQAAARYAQLLDLGEEMGVIPQLEVWGFSKNLHKLSQVMYVAAECGHPEARILPDIYHLYKGGSDFDALKLLDGRCIEIFHVNDYPDSPDRTEIGDEHRVYPGDGIAPVTDVLQALHSKGSPTVLSLELFNRTLWDQDAKQVAAMGLQKMQDAVEGALN